MEAIMKPRKQAAVVLATVLVAMSVRAAAQEPVRSFDQLNTRLKPGDTVWVTDMQGRETRGKIQGLAPNALTLNADGARTFAARDISSIRERQQDSLKNGALIGFGVGGGLALVACLSSAEGSDDAGWCAGLGVGFYGAVGAGLGVGIDALVPGKKRVAYRAPGTAGAAQARVSVAPVMTPRRKGVAVAFSF
jgi:hypothetical protein